MLSRGSKAQPDADVDHGDDAAAQVDRPLDLLRRQRHRGDPFGLKDVLDSQHRNAEKLTLDLEGHVILKVLARMGGQVL